MLEQRGMRLPAQLDRTPRPATLVCPDCGGVVSVHAEGDACYLVFACQVGHAYSAATLIAGKEDRLEAALWSAVYLVEELGELLGDLADRGGPDGREPSWPEAQRRRQRLQRHAKQLRAIIDEDAPIDLGGSIAEQDAE